MTGRGREKRDGERGQILAMTVISLVAICTLVAVATDMGFFFECRRRVQTGADSAAMAGAEQLGTELMNDTQVSPAAHEGAASNGFTDGVDGTHVTVYHPPSSGFHVGKSEFVEAIITQPRPTIFMPILGYQSATVSARAVAGRQHSRNCIYALNRTAKRALNVNGGATVAAACGIVDDLILEGTLYFPTTPLVFSGSSTPTGGAAYTILVADTIEFTGNSSLSNDFSSLSNGSPIKTVALAE